MSREQAKLKLKVSKQSLKTLSHSQTLKIIKRTTVKRAKKKIKTIEDKSKEITNNTITSKDDSTNASAKPSEQIVTGVRTANLKAVKEVAKTPRHAYKYAVQTKQGIKEAKVLSSNAQISKEAARINSNQFKTAKANLKIKYADQVRLKQTPSYVTGYKKRVRPETQAIHNTPKTFKTKSSSTIKSSYSKTKTPQQIAQNKRKSAHIARVKAKSFRRMEELKKISYQNTKETLKETTRAGGRALKSAIKSLTDSAKSFIFIAVLVSVVFMGGFMLISLFTSSFGIFFSIKNATFSSAPGTW